MRHTLVAIFLLFSVVPPAHANAVDKALALALARVAAHEGALHSPADLDLIWQVTHRSGSNSAQRLRWLQAHSPRAIGLRAPKPKDANAFTAELDRTSNVPASIAAGASPQSLAYWRVKVMPKWVALLERADYLVGGGSYDKPCAVEPLTWGGPMDHEVAATSGLYAIGCKNTKNDGFTRRSALKAAGRL